MASFKVRVYIWENGNLSVADYFFHTQTEAMTFIDTTTGDAFKIFDSFGHVIHERKKHHHHHHHHHHHYS